LNCPDYLIELQLDSRPFRSHRRRYWIGKDPTSDLTPISSLSRGPSQRDGIFTDPTPVSLGSSRGHGFANDYSMPLALQNPGHSRRDESFPNARIGAREKQSHLQGSASLMNV
jgi:hypothetical protein